MRVETTSLTNLPTLALFAGSEPPANGLPFTRSSAGEISAKSGHTTYSSQSESSSHLLAVYNRKTGKFTVVSAPVAVISTRIQSDRNQDSIRSDFITQKTTLGLDFGTKKSQKAMVTQQRNKLNEDSFGNISLTTIQDNIVAKSKELPVAEKKPVIISTAIPPPNMEATTPADLYSLSSIISPEEQASLSTLVQSIISASSHPDKMKLLPERRSKFIHNSLKSISFQNKSSKHVLALLVHYSQLLAFYNCSPKATHDRTVLAEKLGNPPAIVLDGIMDRYMEKDIKGTYKLTEVSKTKLISYLCCLSLIISSYNVDIDEIAESLKLGAPKVRSYYESLGCRISSPSAGHIQAMLDGGRATSEKEAKKLKRAVLRYPFSWPTVRKGKQA